MAVNISKLKRFQKAKVMIHLVDAKLNKNHLMHWMPILEKSGVVFSILTRDEASYKALSKIYPNHQILYAQTPVDVETVVVAQPKLKAVLFPLNAAKNIHLLRFNHLKHIFIGTKHSDQLSEINKSYRAYDEIWVSSQSMVDKYNDVFENLGHLDIKVVGKPQLKEMFTASIQNETNTILYFPSKIDTAETSSFLIGDILLKIKEELNLSTSLILENSSLEKDIKELKESFSLNLTLFKDSSMLDSLSVHSDYIVTDIDRVNVFLLVYNKPLFVYISSMDDIEKLTINMPIEALYFFTTAEELVELVSKVKSEDYLREQREYFIEYLLGKEATLNDLFKTKLLEL